MDGNAHNFAVYTEFAENVAGIWLITKYRQAELRRRVLGHLIGWHAINYWQLAGFTAADALFHILNEPATCPLNVTYLYGIYTVYVDFNMHSFHLHYEMQMRGLYELKNFHCWCS